jgi:hypothetical protein
MIAKLILVVFTLAVVQTAMAQAPKDANPADVASLDSIMKAVYDVISGDAGKARDWDRFRSLFYDGARLIPTGKDAQTGNITAHALSPDDYAKRAEPFFAKQGFYERETARRVETYGAVTHVFSTYESRHSLANKTPFARGINSFQLFYDGKRWWVMTIYWQAETPELPIPTKYLSSGS